MIRLRYGVPWVLAACAAAPHGAGQRELVLKLQHQRIEDVLPQLQGQVQVPWTSKVDRSANTATFWGTADALRELLDLVERLDVPAARHP